jgi:hypothetical protein
VCRGMWELGQYAKRAYYRGDGGMQLSDVPSNGMARLFVMFALEGPLFMSLAWYLEQILSSDTGMRKPWRFPFMHAPPAFHARM